MTLWVTLVISLMVHGLLWAVVWYRVPEKTVEIPPAVQKQLIQLVQQAQSQPVPAVPQPSPEPTPEPELKSKSKPKSKPKPQFEPKRTSQPTPKADMASEPLPQPATPPLPPATPQPVVIEEPARPPQQIRQLLTLKQQYLDDVRAVLIENRFYPRKSQRRKHQDRILVRFVVQADGRLTDVILEQSSRYDQLNEATLQLFREKVKTVAPIPAELGENTIQSTVWIEYKL